MDALSILTEDHRSIEALFKRYLAAQSPRLREDLVRRLLHEAKLHTALEEKYVYPIARERSAATLDEHVQSKALLAELCLLPLDHPEFNERLTAFVTELLEHSSEEERLFFPALRKTMGRRELEALGRLILNAREARVEAPVADGLMARAITHLLTAWKTQLGDAFERVCSSMLGLHCSPSPRTTLP